MGELILINQFVSFTNMILGDILNPNQDIRNGILQCMKSERSRLGMYELGQTKKIPYSSETLIVE